MELLFIFGAIFLFAIILPNKDKEIAKFKSFREELKSLFEKKRNILTPEKVNEVNSWLDEKVCQGPYLTSDDIRLRQDIVKKLIVDLQAA